jgi:CheY-like chemotaxis protein
MQESENNRILIVDDNPAIHMDFNRILGSSRITSLDRATAELFGDTESRSSEPTYELTCVQQGESAVEAAAIAVASGKPFALAFVDMRMPPGIDGVETIARMWQVDPAIEAVICTAYSDRTWEEMIQKLGKSDHFLVLKKPFEVEEVSQIAASLTRKWHAKRQQELKIRQIEAQIRARKQELDLRKITYTRSVNAA